MSRRRAQEPASASAAVPEPALVQVTPPPLPRPTTGDGPAAGTAGSAAGEAPGARRVRLEISDGTTLILCGTVVIGRAPTRPEAHAHALTLPDRSRTLSRDHLVVGLTAEGELWAEDQGSANGTYIARGRTWARLPAGERTAIGSQNLIRFADFSLRVHDLPPGS